MKIKVRDIYNFIGVFLLCALYFFETPISLFGTQILTVLQISIILSFILAASVHGRISYSKKVYPYTLMWIMMIPFFLYGLLHSEKMVVFRILFGIIVCLSLATQDDWMNNLKKMLLFFSGSAVFFTFFFWMFPSLYSYVVDFYGYYPPGTGQLKYGYRAGITAHYSQNGIFIAVFIMTLVTLIIAESTRKKSRYTNRLRLIIAGIAFLAFLLNGKRGTLVWCIVAIVLTWFVSTEKKSKVVTRLLSIACVSLVLLQFAVENIPSLNFIVERFSELGSDNSSTDRFAMWGLALLNFTHSPWLGIGFLNFREQYSTNLAAQFIRDLTDISSYRRLDAHNVYIQVLCEMGIIGFVLYVVAIVLLLKNTIKALKYFSRVQAYQYKYVAMLSFCFQSFYLLYSLSGNCLYDMTFYLYIIAMAITGALIFRMDQQGLEYEKDRNIDIS